MSENTHLSIFYECFYLNFEFGFSCSETNM